MAFLDTLLIRSENGKIRMNWYHKPTWSGRYLQYQSNLPHSYKVNTITLLAKKILHLSDEEFHHENFTLLTNTLIDNGYPRKLIKQKIYQAKNPKKLDKVLVNDDKKFVSIPYVRGLHEKLTPLFRKFDLNLVGRADRPLDKILFSKLKDKTPKEQQSNIVYNITCECKKEYVGQTMQYFQTRFKQHKSDGKNNCKTENKSALSQHLSSSGHLIDFDSASVCRREPNRIKRNIFEMMQIRKTPNALNLKADTVHLPSIYDHLLFN
jgi:hypothetical protein